MLRFLLRKVAPWVLLAIAVPLTRMIARRLARTAYRHAVAKPTARALRQADSTVTDVSRRASRLVRR